MTCSKMSSHDRCALTALRRSGGRAAINPPTGAFKDGVGSGEPALMSGADTAGRSQVHCGEPQHGRATLAELDVSWGAPDARGRREGASVDISWPRPTDLQGLCENPSQALLVASAGAADAEHPSIVEAKLSEASSTAPTPSSVEGRLAGGSGEASFVLYGVASPPAVCTACICRRKASAALLNHVDLVFDQCLLCKWAARILHFVAPSCGGSFLTSASGPEFAGAMCKAAQSTAW
eukprot:CAMPEP_0170207012 /NCGR_PEP_ID=MMETSP0116_2-20130129/3076_1 /TAXON_ID=400756 /ORGANISM="Durinskia baltica, Strain CSIRO CS-38" /LENGTH=235 /DNA_ID=CAMNT_0010457455 /DNA_START=435 /DNA_END=1139 /DNA_ORIENTATION=+